jgi:hypothetical protein
VELLIESGYRVDCSVAPGVSWCVESTQPFGSRGANYRSRGHFAPWQFRPASSSMSVWHRSNRSWIRPPALRSAVNRFRPETVWLRPNGRNELHLGAFLRHLLTERSSYAEFMMHSSELMPGGSPTFRTREHIRETLFPHATRVCNGFGQFHGRDTAGILRVVSISDGDDLSCARGRVRADTAFSCLYRSFRFSSPN